MVSVSFGGTHTQQSGDLGYVWGEVNDLGISVPSLNSADLPLRAASGRVVYVTELSFQYRGPARRLTFGWGLKPATSIFGTDFNNGDNLIKDPISYVFSGFIDVPEADVWVVHDVPLMVGFEIPFSGDYPLRGGGTGNIDGETDTWYWLTDTDAIVEAGLPITPSNQLDSSFHVLQHVGSDLRRENTDAGVVEVIPARLAAEVNQFEVRYSF